MADGNEKNESFDIFKEDSEQNASTGRDKYNHDEAEEIASENLQSNLIVPAKNFLLPHITKENIILLLRHIIGITLLIISSLNSIPPILSLTLGITAFAACGCELMIQAILDLKRKNLLSENVLMSFTGIIALCIGEEADGVLLMLLTDIGDRLQRTLIEHSYAIVKNPLLNICQETAKLMLGEEMREVPVSKLEIGDTIMVMPGEYVAVDGIVLNGNSALDTSPITGETELLEVKPGEYIHSGSINRSDTLFLQVNKKYSDSTVCRVATILQEADSRPGKAKRIATDCFRMLTPMVLPAALIIGIAVPLIGNLSFATWIHRALVLLAVSHTCTIITSVSLSYSAGIRGAAKNGILFKSANTLDSVAKLTSVFFDKTGILTCGKFSVTNVEPVRINKDELLYLASYAEFFSSHKIAQAILEYSKLEIDSDRILNYHEEKGQGCVITLITGQVIAAGNLEFLESIGVSGDIPASNVTSIYVSVDKTYVGRIDLSDAVKSDAAESVSTLKKIGIANVALITGDNSLSAMSVGKATGITEIYADCLPQDKIERLKYVLETQEKDDTLAFVGSGVEDVSLLTLANVGIVMGGLDSDDAAGAAGVVLMTDEPGKVPEAIQAAQKVWRLAMQNIVFAFGVKALAIVFGICGIAHMWMAALTDICVASLAIVNAMRAFVKS